MNAVAHAEEGTVRERGGVLEHRGGRWQARRNTVKNYVAYINGDWSARRFDACAGGDVYSPITASIEYRTSTSQNWRPLR